MSDIKVGDRVVRRVSYDEGEVVAVSTPHQMCKVRWGDDDEQVRVEYASDLKRVDDLSLQDEVNTFSDYEAALDGFAASIAAAAAQRDYTLRDVIDALTALSMTGDFDE